MKTSKRVAIIGAGPSGLAAAKSLVHDHPPGTFVPVIYERKSHVGGIWPVSCHDQANIVPPEMPTNVSKHIASFSDLAWDSLQLPGIQAPVQRIATFPAAHQVGKYLETYADRYLPAGSIKFGQEVINVSCSDGVAPVCTMTSRALAEGGKPIQELFDYVVVASGFFAAPQMPPIPGLETFSGPVVHSSQLRDIDSLLDQMNGAKKIVVVGGSMSGGEAAAKLAFHISSLRHRVNDSSIDPEQLTVHNISPRPFWSVPTFVPADPIVDGVINPRPIFRPLDLILADLNRRPSGEIRFAPSATFAPEVAKMFNGMLGSMVGTDQSELGNGALAIPPSSFHHPPWLIISPTYSEFVRSGEIEVVLGRVAEVCGKMVKVEKDDEEEMAELDDVGMIVLATGFTPHSALSFLSPAIRATLEHDPNNDYDPIKLFNFATMHPAIPTLGFVGFYRGPYFGVLEQQARFLGALWSGSLPSAPTEPPARVDKLEQRGQFPMGDYCGLMESFSAILHTEPLPLSSSNKVQERIAIPAIYAGPSIRRAPQAAYEQAKACESIIEILARPSLFLAPAIFRALQGKWKVTREVKSARSSHPSGRFTGEANLYPRSPTAGGYGAECLYTERGEFVTAAGLRMEGVRSYVYRLSELEPQTISVWFVSAEGGSREVDTLFHQVEVGEEATNNDRDDDDADGWGHGWRARGSHHVCEDDHYDTEYWFHFRAIDIQAWGIGYTVQGPSKEYWTRATYVR